MGVIIFILAIIIIVVAIVSRSSGGSGGSYSSSGSSSYGPGVKRKGLSGSGRPGVCANIDPDYCSGRSCQSCSRFEALDADCKNYSSSCDSRGAHHSCDGCHDFESISGRLKNYFQKSQGGDY